jgi:hypothetical protein
MPRPEVDLELVGGNHILPETGFSRVENFLPVLLTHGVHEGRITLAVWGGAP